MLSGEAAFYKIAKQFYEELNLFRNTFSLKSLVLPIVIFVVLLFLPPVIPRFYTYILAVIFVTALVAMSLNMVVGHGGLFQFHHDTVPFQSPQIYL